MARQNAFRIAESITSASQGHDGNHMLMLDMQDQGVTDATLALHNDIQVTGLPVAVTLQAHLNRSSNDMKSLVSLGATVRLFKGAFAAGGDVAYTTRRDVKSNSRDLIDVMFSNEAKKTGFKPVIATHDGERARLYTPFGSDQWPHAMRRIGENPANGMLLARSLVSGQRSHNAGQIAETQAFLVLCRSAPPEHFANHPLVSG